jgi:Large polyvalent protein associated domain 22
MSDAQDYLAWKQQADSLKTNQAALIVGDASQTNPDQYAKDMQLGRSFNIPASMAADGRDVFSQKLKDAKTQLLLKTAPVLRDWVSNQDNARVAHDDLQSLSWFDGFGRGVGNTAARAGLGLAAIPNEMLLESTAQRSRDKGKSFGDILNTERQALPDGSKLWATPSDLIGATARYIDVQYASMIGTDDKANATSFAENLASLNKSREAHGQSQIAQEFYDKASTPAQSTSESLTNWLSAVATHPTGALSWALETGGESAPQILAAIGIGAATKNPTAAVAAIGGGSYLAERYSSPADFLKEKGIDMNNPQDVQRIISDPTLMKEAAQRGVIRGAIIGMFDALSGGLAGKAMAHNPIIESVAQMAQQAILGGGGEAAAQAVAGQPVDINSIIANGLAEIATAPADMIATGHELMTKKNKAAAVPDTEKNIDELSQAAMASKLKERSPHAFEDYTNKATAGTPMEHVYVDPRPIQTYLQAAGIDPQHFFQDLAPGSFDDYQMALATKGDLKIPTGTYAAKIIGSDLEPLVREHMRFEPQAMTIAEGNDFEAAKADLMQSHLESLAQNHELEQSVRTHEAAIYDDMVERLRVAGRSADVARQEAAIFPAFFKAMAARAGTSIDEFAQQFTLPAVRGHFAEGMKFKDAPEIDRMVETARTFKDTGAGTSSLLEWIDKYGGITDKGGELKSRDAMVIKRGKGKKSLRIGRADNSAQGNMLRAAGPNKHSIDVVAQEAVANGFMADHSVVQAYKNAVANGAQAPDLSAALLDAIDAELQGKPQRTADGASADKAHADKVAQVQDLEQHLASLGLTLADGNEKIKAAIMADQARAVRTYRQNGIEKSSSYIDPLLQSGGDWRNSEVTATLEDGEQVQVHAGDAVEHITERLKAAQEILDCINAA